MDEAFELFMPDQQSVAKIYHSPIFGLNPELFGVSKGEMRDIRKYGLPDYVRRGGKLCPAEFIFAFNMHIKTFYSRNKGSYNPNGIFQGKRAIIFHNSKRNEVLIFRDATKKFWTGEVGENGQSPLPLGTKPPE